MSADTLRAKLAELGTRVDVEALGRVAVVTPNTKVDLDAQARRRIVSAARQHGFSNVCVELTPSKADPSLLRMTPADANLPGD